MGGAVSELVFAKSGPTVILLAGLQGVGKTTVCAKLAFYLKKQVHFQKLCVCVCVCMSVYIRRPHTCMYTHVSLQLQHVCVSV